MSVDKGMSELLKSYLAAQNGYYLAVLGFAAYVAVRRGLERAYGRIPAVRRRRAAEEAAKQARTRELVRKHFGVGEGQ